MTDESGTFITTASMGPRSRERGDKPQPLTYFVADSLLQWGRAHVSAEITTLITGLQNKSSASMGPRSRERGDPYRHQRTMLGVIASMGPRSRERGDDGKPIRKIFGKGRFNGAALT